MFAQADSHEFLCCLRKVPDRWRPSPRLPEPVKDLLQHIEKSEIEEPSEHSLKRNLHHERHKLEENRCYKLIDDYRRRIDTSKTPCTQLKITFHTVSTSCHPSLHSRQGRSRDLLNTLRLTIAKATFIFMQSLLLPFTSFRSQHGRSRDLLNTSQMNVRSNNSNTYSREPISSSPSLNSRLSVLKNWILQAIHFWKA